MSKIERLFKLITQAKTPLGLPKGISPTPKQIDALPNLQAGESLKNFEMSDVERDLMGFFVNMGVSTPHYIYSKWASGNDNIGRSKRLAKQFLPLIRQWKISCKSYLELENIEATWFIDPPYQHGGKRYKVHDIDYDILAAWSRSRKGQVIVCENTPANWLPFKPLVQMTGQRTRTTELIWTNTK